MSENKGKLIILSAPSGAGKTTICKELAKINKEWVENRWKRVARMNAKIGH